MTTSRKALAAMGFGLGLALLPHLASAQPVPFPNLDDRYEERDVITRAPRHGYSGWARAPFSDYYCDYQRIPVRRCDSGGCRAVAWRLRQYCY
jgi:hypothetical protein